MRSASAEIILANAPPTVPQPKSPMRMVESDSDFIVPTVSAKARVLRVDLSLNGLKQTATVQLINIKGQKIFD